MANSPTTPATDGPTAPPPGPQLQVERLPGTTRRPIAIALAIVASLTLFVWAPWGRAAPDTATGPVQPSAAPLQARASGTAPSATPGSTRASAVPWPALAGVGRYASIVDNEWTVVALLTSSPAASTEEPSIQHVSAPAPSPDGPFQVLQQGTTELLAPAERPGHPEAPCAASAWSRDRIAVHLPAGRVVYLGVTFPGMDVRARVAAVVLDRPGITMRRASPLVVELTGMVTGRQYTVPATGPGGTLLFGLTPAGVLPSETYRFAIAAPGVRGERYLYACVGS